MKCSNCGTELPDDAKFCASCGSRVEKPAAEPVTEAAPAAEIEAMTEAEATIVPVAADETPAPVIETPAPEIAEPVAAEPADTEPVAAEPSAVVQPVQAPQPVVTPVAPAEPAGFTCPQCQNPLKPGAQFCGKCGARLGQPAEPRQVFCQRCGNKIKADAVFCPSCGSRQQAGGPSPAAAAPVPQAPIQQQAAYPQYAQQPAYPAYGQYPNPYQAAPVKPKKKKGWLVAVIIVLVLAVGGFGVYSLFGRPIKRALLGPKASYLEIEGLALKDEAADAIDTLVKYGNSDTQEKGGIDLDLAVTLDADALQLDPQIASIFERLRINNTLMYDRSGEMPKVYDNLEIKALEEHLANVEILYDNGEMVIRATEIFDEYLVATADDLASMFSGSDISIGDIDMSQLTMLSGLLTGSGAMDLGIDEKNLNKSVSKIVDIILAHIDTCELKSGVTLTAGSVSAKYDCYSMSISKESARQMMIEILELIRDDDEFFNLYQKLSGAFDTSGEGAEITREQYESELQSAIDEVSDTTSDTTDFTIYQDVYVDSKDKVVGRDLKVIDDTDTTLLHIQYAQPANGAEEAYLVMLDDGYESFSFLADYTISGDKKTGTAKISTAGTDVLTVDFQNYIHIETDTSDKILGTFDIKIVDTSSMGEGVPGEFILDISEDGDRTLFSLSIPDMLTVDLGYAEISEKDVSFPSFAGGTHVSMSDSDALSQVMDADAQEKITAIMEKLGIDMSQGY